MVEESGSNQFFPTIEYSYLLNLRELWRSMWQRHLLPGILVFGCREVSSSYRPVQLWDIVRNHFINANLNVRF